MPVELNHASAYAHDPRKTAEDLAALCGGNVVAFSPLPGAWVCQFGPVANGPFIELYPRTSRFALHEGAIRFEAMPVPATGAGSHLNLRVDRSRTELERICAERGLKHGWRSWAGFLDVWLDEGLMIELLCRS